MAKRIYIASSWRHQHAVELITDLLRKEDYEVLSFVENNHGENPDAAMNQDQVRKEVQSVMLEAIDNALELKRPGEKPVPFDEWCYSPSGDKSWKYDTEGATKSDLVLYIGGSGKDAAAECGMAWASGVPIIGLFQKGEDFGLMRRMMTAWIYDYRKILTTVFNIIGSARITERQSTPH